MKLRLLCLIFLLLSLPFIGLCQHPEDRNGLAKELLIKSNEPSVFISFEKSGKAHPLFQGETDDRYWLRLRNNTKGDIEFCYFEVEKQYGDIAIRYNIEQENNFGSEAPVSSTSQVLATQGNKTSEASAAEQIPNGYALGDSCLVYRLSSGRSVLFSVPKVHLNRSDGSFRIDIPFKYGWEDGSSVEGSPPRHIISFSSGKLPKEISKGENGVIYEVGPGVKRTNISHTVSWCFR